MTNKKFNNFDNDNKNSDYYKAQRLYVNNSLFKEKKRLEKRKKFKQSIKAIFSKTRKITGKILVKFIDSHFIVSIFTAFILYK